MQSSVFLRLNTVLNLDGRWQKKAKMKEKDGPKSQNESKWRPKRPKWKEMKAQKAKMKGNEGTKGQKAKKSQNKAQKARKIPPRNAKIKAPKAK